MDQSLLLPAFVNNGTQTYTFVYVLLVADFCHNSTTKWLYQKPRDL